MLKEVLDIMVSLLAGLWITLKQMFTKGCTIQYPEQRLVWPDRTRGRVVLPKDAETGKNRCTICLACTRICPNGSLEITAGTNEAGKRELLDFVYHLERCTFCGLCVEACPFSALFMSHEHEIATVDKKTLKRHLQKENYNFNPAWKGGLKEKA